MKDCTSEPENVNVNLEGLERVIDVTNRDGYNINFSVNFFLDSGKISKKKIEHLAFSKISIEELVKLIDLISK